MSTLFQDNPKAKQFIPKIRIEEDALIAEGEKIPFADIEGLFKTNMASSKISFGFFFVGIFGYTAFSHHLDSERYLLFSLFAIPFMINYLIKRRWYILYMSMKEETAEAFKDAPLYTLMITKDESAIDALAEKIRKATKKAGHEILFASRKV